MDEMQIYAHWLERALYGIIYSTFYFIWKSFSELFQIFQYQFVISRKLLFIQSLILIKTAAANGVTFLMDSHFNMNYTYSYVVPFCMR